VTKILLNALLPVFFTLSLGWFAGWRKIIDNRQLLSINILLMNFALPVSLFVAMARTPMAMLRDEGLLVAALAIAMVVIYAVTWTIQRRFFHRSKQAAAVQSLTVAFPNCAAVGLSLLPAVFGPGSTAVAAIGIAVGAIIISPLTLAILESEQRLADGVKTDTKLDFLYAIGRSFRRPIVFAPIAGLLMTVSGVGLHPLVAPTLMLLGQGAAGIALFLTGLILSAQPFRWSKDMSMGVLLKNVAQPYGMFLLLHLVHIPPVAAAEAVLLTAVPAGFFGTVFGARFGVQAPEASATLITSTILSAVTLSLVILWIQHP
jgi:predicted permease